MSRETSQQKRVRETRESVLRALWNAGVPMSASSLEGNLDVGRYYTGLGFVGVRSQREISAALTWLVKQGEARKLPASDRTPDDPEGALYVAVPVKEVKKPKPAVKKFRFTPDSIQDELTDRIEQGWSNDRIAREYDDVGPNLKRWLNSRRSKLRKFWDSF